MSAMLRAIVSSDGREWPRQRERRWHLGRLGSARRRVMAVAGGAADFSQAALTEAATVAKVCKIPRTGFSDRLQRHTGKMTWLAGCVRTEGRPARRRCHSRDLKEETFLMPTLNRRAAGRRRAWGRGPIILRFDSLEPRELLTAPPPLADLAGSSLVTTHAADWGDTVGVQGNIVNQGGSTVTVPFEVALYASPSTAIGRYAVPDRRSDDSGRSLARPDGSVQHDRQAAGHADPGREQYRRRLHRYEDRPDR